MDYNKIIFGTDGIRGPTNSETMNAEIALRVGKAIGGYIKCNSGKCDNFASYKVVIGKDTRLSCYMIENALVAGLTSVGIDVKLLGPIPTPAVSYLTKSLRCDIGIMVTASHNQYEDNGIKIIDSNGNKISDEAQTIIQQLASDSSSLRTFWSSPDMLGKVVRIDDVSGRYIEHAKRAFPKTFTLDGMRIVLDCANGASYKVAPRILSELGADIISIGCSPNGTNINRGCGALDTGLLSEKVIETRADLGIALDGDGDRIVICDENGHNIQGDYIIGIIARYFKSLNNGNLKNSVVLTRMSNNGLIDYLSSIGIDIVYTEVGDRNILREMDKGNALIGGENSGHIIIKEYGNTSDAMITALHILTIMRELNSTISEIIPKFELHPHYKQNVFFESNPLHEEDILIKINEIIEMNKHLKIVVRASGTEKAIRITVEGRNLNEINEIGQNIKSLISK